VTRTICRQVGLPSRRVVLVAMLVTYLGLLQLFKHRPYAASGWRVEPAAITVRTARARTRERAAAGRVAD
jgi:hypothetical protein